MAIMAGIVAGAESARRRQQQRRQQLRKAESAADSAAVGSRRSSSSSSSSSSSFSLFYHATKGDATQLNRQIVRGNNNNNYNYYYYMNKEFHDWNLGSGAREAKDRLDEKLRNRRASSSVIKRRYSMVSIVGAALQKEIFSYRTSSTRRFNWSRLAWSKNVEAKPDHAATECAVCLEEFRAGDELTHLPCAHRFHRSCAVPWLEISPHCPFCRTCIFSSSK